MAEPEQGIAASQWTGNGPDHDHANKAAARRQWRHAGAGGAAAGAMGTDHWVLGLVIASVYLALWLLFREPREARD
ncbi:hypothetical protein GCM10007874_49630 [Labrys miyagiensis]|uniref:Uncharacterized protein n=1 Tax=Labrys miyagiensis TaxID=346912 RepID=A0ABQ6CNN2_9HYPH|nr:hypothetical protein [Labrys miyagiensis]GLS21946.1 hypothetical protein GCM10007874_49630 [Labrys miyagiensis]